MARQASQHVQSYQTTQCILLVGAAFDDIETVVANAHRRRKGALIIGGAQNTNRPAKVQGAFKEFCGTARRSVWIRVS